MAKNREHAIGGLLAGAALLLPAHAFAQPASTGDQNGAPPTVAAAAPEEIIVTANKRSERLLDVPLSITAITGEDIARRNATNISDIQQIVPSFRIVQLGVGTQRVEIRGISQYVGQPTVGSYLDEVSVNAGAVQGSQLDVRLVDLDRIEVLRGPQPTLYGEGSVGGTVRYVAASPDLTRFGGHFDANVGFVTDGGTAERFDAVANLPIVADKLGVRIAVDHEDTGGYIDIPAIGRKDGNNISATTLRGKILAKPSDKLTLSLLIQHQSESQANQNFSAENRTSIAAVPTPTKDVYTVGNLVASYDFGPVTLLSTTGIIDRHSTATYDVTPFYQRFFALFGLPANTTVPEGSTAASYSETEEVRLTTNTKGPFRALLGGVYTNARTYGAFSIVTQPVPFAPLAYDSNGVTRSESWSIFGSAGYDITSRLTLSVGGRYFEEKRRSVNSTAFGGGPFSTLDQSGKFHSFNPRIDLSYKTSPDGLVYFNAAKGFRSGGFNPPGRPGVPIPPTFAPEKLYSYELGTKQQLMHRRAAVELSVYYNDYQGVQSPFPIYDANGVQVSSATTNQGKANGIGVDFGASFKVTPAFTVAGNVGYNDVRFQSKSTARLKGDPLDLTPDLTWSAAGDYRHALNDRLGFTAHLDAGHTGQGVLTIRNFQPQTFSDPYTLVNGRIGLDFKRFKLYGFANNIFDENRIVQPAFGGYAEPLRTRPRTVGIGVRADF